MPFQLIKGDRVPIRLWTPLSEVDTQALRQLKRVAALPWVAHHVAVMPDLHAGKGATVGTVIAQRGAVCPAAVGVDIGCGMAALETNPSARDLPDDLKPLRIAIESAVPLGPRQHRGERSDALTPELALRTRDLIDRFHQLDPSVQSLQHRALQQLGTFGGGNHFIELCLDQQGGVWLMLHSGSRHIGAALAEHHMQIARKLFHNRELPDPELGASLAGTPQFEAYRRDLFWAQEYAALNRAVLLELVAGVLRRAWPHVMFGILVSCHHNYVAEEMRFGEELLITRKGAIRAGQGELGIIPGSMGAKSFIVRGKGSQWSFESASHGAGRRMSRGQARKTVTLADLQRQTQGVECRKDAAVIDEAPSAYKRIEGVMAQQEDLVEVVTELKQVLCVKG
jgi:tRNA-splicing ligase RtcB